MLRSNEEQLTELRVHTRLTGSIRGFDSEVTDISELRTNSDDKWRATPSQQLLMLEGETAKLEIIEFLIVWLIAGLPFDVASETWFLIGRDWLIRQDRIERSPQVMPVDRLVTAGPAIIQLASVDERPVGVE